MRRLVAIWDFRVIASACVSKREFIKKRSCSSKEAAALAKINL